MGSTDSGQMALFRPATIALLAVPDRCTFAARVLLDDVLLYLDPHGFWTPDLQAADTWASEGIALAFVAANLKDQAQRDLVNIVPVRRGLVVAS